MTIDFGIYSRRGPGTHRAPCPECDRGPKDDALAVTVDDRGIVAYCHRCGYTATEQRESRPQEPRQRPAARVASPTPDWRPLWSAAQPIAADSIAAQYLLHRGCRLPPAEGDLRWLPAHRHPSGHVGPALVARVTHAVTGESMTLHRTWITATGKADIDKPRLLWPGHPSKNGVVRLWPDEAVTMGLGVAEGIETALSLAHAMTPVWSCLDAGNVGDLPVLGGVECLTIAADHDTAGIKAARQCATRWLCAGREGRIVASDVPGQDVNDMVMA